MLWQSWPQETVIRLVISPQVVGFDAFSPFAMTTGTREAIALVNQLSIFKPVFIEQHTMQ